VGPATVILDGDAVNACLVLAGQADGCEVLTIEGLMVDGTPHRCKRPLSKPGGAVWFLYAGAILASKALLDRVPDPPTTKSAKQLSGKPVPLHGLTSR